MKASFRRELPVLAAIFLFWFSMYTYPSFFSAYVSDRLMAPEVMTGLIVGAYGFAQMVLPIPLGIASDWTRRRKPFVALTAFCGLMAGGGLLWAGDWAYGRLAARGGPATEGARRRLMLMAGMTLHNIPEGMAVGVAFGSLAHGLDGATLPAACMLAVGVGIQNFPEGAAVSLPLLRDGLGRGKAFFLGQLSAVVEPLAGVAGAVLVLGAQRMLPGMLSFAAGAMLYVAIAELIPESLANERRGLMAVVTLAGFGVMMVLDVALG